MNLRSCTGGGVGTWYLWVIPGLEVGWGLGTWAIPVPGVLGEG